MRKLGDRWLPEEDVAKPICCVAADTATAACTSRKADTRQPDDALAAAGRTAHKASGMWRLRTPVNEEHVTEARSEGFADA